MYISCPVTIGLQKSLPKVSLSYGVLLSHLIIIYGILTTHVFITDSCPLSANPYIYVGRLLSGEGKPEYVNPTRDVSEYDVKQSMVTFSMLEPPFYCFTPSSSVYTHSLQRELRTAELLQKLNFPSRARR